MKTSPGDLVSYRALILSASDVYRSIDAVSCFTERGELERIAYADSRNVLCPRNRKRFRALIGRGQIIVSVIAHDGSCGAQSRPRPSARNIRPLPRNTSQQLIRLRGSSLPQPIRMTSHHRSVTTSQVEPRHVGSRNIEYAVRHVDGREPSVSMFLGPQKGPAYAGPFVFHVERSVRDATASRRGGTSRC